MYSIDMRIVTKIRPSTYCPFLNYSRSVKRNMSAVHFLWRDEIMIIDTEKVTEKIKLYYAEKIRQSKVSGFREGLGRQEKEELAAVRRVIVAFKNY